jgi:hypothetical protein
LAKKKPAGTKTQPDGAQKIRDELSIKSPDNHQSVVAFSVSFIVNFAVYLFTLAPTVTFEDSGELISAAFNRGVPHEPGYPLFTLIGRVFTLLPLGTIAYRVNLMSAFFTALAGGFVCFAVIFLVERTFRGALVFTNLSRRATGLIASLVGITCAILFCTASATWEQAIIAEVYGINSFCVGLFLLLAFKLAVQPEYLQKQKLLLLMSYISGVALANHTTSLELLPFLGICLLFYERKLLLNAGFLIKSLFFVLLGLTPYLYLPLASRRHPIIDWGNPENATNFFRVISRHQYNDGAKHTLESFFSQISVFCSEMLLSQWVPFVLIFAVIGIVFVFLKNRIGFYFILVVLLFTVPITTWMTNFDVTTPASAFENKALVSVFYIPAYMMLSILIGVGLFGTIGWVRVKKTLISIAIALVLPFIALGGALVGTMPKISKHNYFFAERYCENVLKNLPENSLYFVNWDPFHFPVMYYQFVEKKRPDVLVLDQMLLRRSWYVHMLERHHPEMTLQLKKELDGFLLAVEPFESGKPYNGTVIQSRYIAMINAFIDTKLRMKDNVYFSYIPEPAITRFYHVEPRFFAYKYTNEPIDTSIRSADLNITGFAGENSARDRMAEYVRNYYGNVYALRGLQLDSLGNWAQARDCLSKAKLFFQPASQQAMFIDLKLKGKPGQ